MARDRLRPLAPEDDLQLPLSRKVLITLSVMLVTFMQILDTSVTNVAITHMQGSMSASVEEITWVITSYLAANAIVLPATGWLSGVLGRKRFFLISVTLFTVSSFLSGIAPNLTFLILARILQGIGGGPLLPLSQAIMWEIFPLAQRGMAMAIWGVGIMFAPIIGPTLGGWITDNWSWPWIFYINLPVGIAGFFMASAFLFDPPYLKRVQRIDALGLALMVLGFGSLQLVLDRGEREDWFDSNLIITLTVLGGAAVVLFLLRQLASDEPVVDLSVFRDRNFAPGALIVAMVMFGLFSTMLLQSLYMQKLLGYDALSAGLALAPAGLGNMISLLLAGRLVTRMDQRLLLGFGCVVNAIALSMMGHLSLSVDYWHLAVPRLIQGLGVGFIFVPLTTLAMANIPRDRLGNATTLFNVVRNFGGSAGVALAATFLARRSQVHQASLVSHVNIWDPETAHRIGELTQTFFAQGADPHTARGQALAMLYKSVVEQATVLAFMDDFWLITLLFIAVIFLIPLFRRVHMLPPAPSPASAGD
ncbi:MAG: DHA2 family efflux MFS transporter permease subunit [Candidatus Rokubacteria bacterium]|nr:DHA2 family efflux MFS transporter permease subunit [Candidatus Rokubacteria bacterium]